MSITVTRDKSGKMKHVVAIRAHRLTTDEGPENGGEDAGPAPHDLFDAALGACKALTTLWYAKRKDIPVDGIEVTVERDDSEERKGVYRLKTTVALTGALTDAQRQELVAIAAKCPMHKLMTQVTTQIETELVP